MQLGLSTFTYTWWIAAVTDQSPLHKALDLVERSRELGVSVLQIADNLPLQGWSDSDLVVLRAAADEAGVGLEVGTRGIEQERILRYLQIASVLGSRLLRVVVDTATSEPSPTEVVSRLSPLRSRFESAGVTLAIENHDRFRAHTLAAIVRDLDVAWSGVCLDTVNSFGALEGPHTVVTTLAPLVVNLHVKDFVVRRVPHQMGFVIEGRPAGQGALDIPWLFEQLSSHGRDCSAILELWTPPDDSEQATIERERRWADESVDYLKSQIHAATPGLIAETA